MKRRLNDSMESKEIIPPNAKLSPEEVSNLIPIFNSNSSLSLNSEEWIDEVENVSALNNWDEKLTMFYASQRLEDEALTWYQSNVCNWKEFKLKFIKVFPIQQHCSQFIGELFKRHKNDSETFEEYVNDVAEIAKKCNFNLPTAITYIISGLPDVNMRNRLIAYNCKSISEILSRIQTITYNLEQEAKWDDGTNKTIPKEVTTIKKDPSDGPLAGKSVVTSNSNLPPKIFHDCEDLVMTVQVIGVDFKAFVDVTSKFTTMQESEFRKQHWKLKRCDDTLGEFGTSKPLGKTIKDIRVDKVEMLIEILIVEDKMQKHPIVLGRNFLHNTNVSVVKHFNSLEVNYVYTPSTSPCPIPKKRKRYSGNQRRFFNPQQQQHHQLMNWQQVRGGGYMNFQNNEQTYTFNKQISVIVREERYNMMRAIAQGYPERQINCYNNYNDFNFPVDENRILNYMQNGYF